MTCEVNVHRWMCPCRSWTAYHLGENDQSKNKTYNLWPAYGHFFSGIHWPNRNISPTLQVAILPFEKGDVAMPHVTTAVGFSYIILFPPQIAISTPSVNLRRPNGMIMGQLILSCIYLPRLPIYKGKSLRVCPSTSTCNPKLRSGVEPNLSRLEYTSSKHK